MSIEGIKVGTTPATLSAQPGAPTPSPQAARLILDAKIRTTLDAIDRLIPKPSGRPSELGFPAAVGSPSSQPSVRMMSTLGHVAYQDTIENPSVGVGLKRVLSWMAQPPYSVDAKKIPDEALQGAGSFDAWLRSPQNAASIGLKRLDLNDPRSMEQGAIVITKPGSYSHHARIGVATLDPSKDVGTDRSVLANGELLQSPNPDQVSSIYVPANWQQPQLPQIPLNLSTN